jgi:CubicO group peptidase (beta-lactamase class C family)
MLPLPIRSWLAAVTLIVFATSRSSDPALGHPTVPSEAIALDTLVIDRSIADEMRVSHTPGVAVAIVSKGKIAYAKGYGVASIETRQPVTPDMLFRIGSVTKMFTGLTALMLEREGQVKLGAPIGGYAHGLHPVLGRRTLRQLLAHTGGMIAEAAGDGPHDDSALGARMRSWGPEHTFAEPGDIYSYSGPGYWLAGYAIEQAAGAPYADVVAEKVLAPLGMRRSTFRPLMALTWPLALDHRVTGDSVRLLRPYPDDVTTWASGSLFSSANELARFAIALIDSGRVDGQQVIPADAVRMMHTRQSAAPGAPCGYTYGLSECRFGGVRTLSHYGFRIGSGAVFTVAPEQRAAVIILANRNGAIFGRTAQVAMNMLAPSREQSSESEPRPVALNAARRRRFAGVYAAGSDTLRLTVRGDSLVYRYGSTDQPTRADANDTTSILILGREGEVVQQFSLVRGKDGRTDYLHDGLNAFRRVSPAPR